MRILVLRGGALGDFIVTLPALALLRTRWPGARIEFAGNAVAAGLALRRGLIDAVHSQHERRWASLFGRDPLPAEFAAWLASFDVVLNFWPDPQQELRGRFPARTGQVFLASGASPVLRPAAAHFCEPLRTLGLEPREFRWPLSPLTMTPAAAPRPVALHPGSGSPRKNWPADRWASLARWLRDKLALPLLVISGEAEPAGVLGDYGPGLRDRPIEEVVTQLAGCRLFIGHDSGISHLAGAAGARCVLLFGPTDPAMWAPPGPGVRVVHSGAEMSAISLAEVQQAVVSALPDQA